MTLREFLKIANDIENKELNIVDEDILVTIRYSLIFNRLNAMVSINNTESVLSLKLIDSELILDLTEDNLLSTQVSNSLYLKIINTIMKEEL